MANADFLQLPVPPSSYLAQNGIRMVNANTGGTIIGGRPQGFGGTGGSLLSSSSNSSVFLDMYG